MPLPKTDILPGFTYAGGKLGERRAVIVLEPIPGFATMVHYRTEGSPKGDDVAKMGLKSFAAWATDVVDCE